jgi:hypothetical protein
MKPKCSRRGRGDARLQGVREKETRLGDGPNLRVLGLLVSPEVDLPLKGPSAEVAGEGFEARVLPTVGDQVRALAEGFTAHLALVRFFT